MAAPVRIQLSRRKGFNLQEVSNALNGLPAVKVTRPGRWGNDYRVGTDYGDGYGPYSADLAVERYRFDMEMVLRGYTDECVTAFLEKGLSDIRGKNLACFCALDAPCHADVLLDLANRPTCEEVAS